MIQYQDNDGPNIGGPRTPPSIGVMAPTPVRKIAPPTMPNTSPMPAAMPTLPGAAPMAPKAPPMQVPYAGVSAINPQNDLRGAQITPGATPDRLQFAKDKFAQFQSDLAPQIESQRRGLLKNGAAFGRLGSGMLRTDFGNLSSEVNRQNVNEQNRLFTNAAEASVGDDANARNELRGERGYQNAMEQSAFDRSRGERMDQEDLLNSSFQRALQRGNFGYGGNPANYVGGAAQDQQARADGSTQGFLDVLGRLGGRLGSKPASTPPYFPEHPYDQPDY